MFFEDSSQNDKYKDIINMPHYQSQTRAHMSLHDRAAQFAPFAALTGHDAAISETARRTESKPEIDDEIKLKINTKLRKLMEMICECPKVQMEYFVPDKRKSGGACIVYKGILCDVDEYTGCVTLEDGKEVYFEDILDMEYDEQYDVDSDAFKLYGE